MHPLDTNDRRELIKEEMGLGYCNITKCCTEVCPEHIHITDNAIIPLKERVVDADYDPVAWLGRKITRRTKKTAADAAVQPAPSSWRTSSRASGSSRLNQTLGAAVPIHLEGIPSIGSRRDRVPRRAEQRSARDHVHDQSEGAASSPGDHLAADAIVHPLLRRRRWR
jgi:hypothetical protein